MECVRSPALSGLHGHAPNVIRENGYDNNPWITYADRKGITAVLMPEATCNRTRLTSFLGDYHRSEIG